MTDKYINATQMLIDEQEAYMKAAQLKVDDMTQKINEIVHIKLQKLLIDAVEENVIALPCKAGNTVYCIKELQDGKFTKTIIVGEITKWSICEFTKTARVFITDDTRYTDIDYNLFGKTVFLTKEEAVQALKETEKNA